MLVGYARVSTAEQHLDPQLAQLHAAGADKVFSEKVSGTTAKRPQLLAAIEFAREGDVFVVTRLDRFARSSVDLHNLIQTLSNKGVGFRCIEQAGVDTTTSSGKLMLGMLGAVAEFETALRAERQAEGIAKAKADGRYQGRKATIDPAEVRRLLGEGMKPSAVAKALGIGRASVYRLAA
ncbi:recombinase family protein [Sphingomonas sp. G-3-2-10]|uniref:recombinase family protein n=1 Tax=Sphingomonas sp. G-3-2-10 TaxID=2728838 RepID=UPI00146F2B61|nr:recombinase family protein [Sphingomonas sp. G-3-2-10]NML04285.1 recombinase family protein [Sphingomonas sp. G-3-2-10]